MGEKAWLASSPTNQKQERVPRGKQEKLELGPSGTKLGRARAACCYRASERKRVRTCHNLLLIRYKWNNIRAACEFSKENELLAKVRFCFEGNEVIGQKWRELRAVV